MKTYPRRFVIVISGRGSNMQAIFDVLQRHDAATICAVVSNRADAKGLEWARARGVTTRVVEHTDYANRDTFDGALGDVIDSFKPDYVLLAGFMRILTPAFVERFNGRVINIHPSLLPAFPGLHTHQQAIAAGVQWHGCTVHFVTPVLDHGPVIAQGIVPVYAQDDPETLAQRVLKVEHTVFAQVARWLADGCVTLDTVQRVHVDGAPCRSFMLTPRGVELVNTDHV